MDTQGHIGQVRYHMARFGHVRTEQFDISGCLHHLKALGADRDMLDYVALYAKEDGWMLARDEHRFPVEDFLKSREEVIK